ncbi:src kinase-associated phosphoprotein 1 isoform X2 [Siniperca chuatsi]|uniref:src kinase-associated phosphoprotein 1 isoform X2 n=1 Tax=Siniperca chuatsi TaxID=119488 RepID=UPI001CE19B44|nr:src kinase-associated phosphoprotein 1 isoform X2 [Siniperca chuatsi]
MGTIPNDIRRLLDDCELFVSDILQDENLSENAEETRKVLLNNFRVVHVRNPQEFPFPSDYREEDGSDDNRSSSLGRSVQSDDASLASDNQDDGPTEYFDDIPLVAVQDLSNILKQGYLEKKRRDHSFFGSEWQKRWCVLNNSIFYYFGSEKDKQQKGSFHIMDYNVQLVTNLRKDSKKNACFELFAPGLRAFQFTASSPQEAREWVKQINFVLEDLRSTSIPCDDDEDVEEEEETYDDIEGLTGPSPPWPSAAQASQRGRQGGGQEMGEDDEEDEDIYEVLPDDFPDPIDESSEKNNKTAWSSDYANYYQGLWDCQADEPDELDFQRGDLIYIINKEYNIHGWWVGELNGTVGIVPKDFLHPAYIL